MQRETQVVVRAEHQRRLAGDQHFAWAEHALDRRLSGHEIAGRKRRPALLNRTQLVEEVHPGP
jgi:hypothetical protein